MKAFLKEKVSQVDEVLPDKLAAAVIVGLILNAILTVVGFIYDHFISEGYSEKEAYSKMANLTEEQLDEFLKALAQAGMRGAQSIGKATRGVSTSLAKQGAMSDPKFKRLGSVQGPAPNTPSQTLTDLRQRRQQQSDNLRSRIDTAASQLKSGSLKFHFDRILSHSH